MLTQQDNATARFRSGASGSDARRLAWVIGALALAAAALTLWRWSLQLAPSAWWGAASAPLRTDPGQLVFHFSSLPRFATALVAGAGLGLAGTLFQQVLRNPLASPTTLGVEQGAQLALTVALIFAPAWLAWSPGLVTLTGAGLVMLAVFAAASASRFSPLSLILAGLVSGLFCMSLSVALRLLNEEFVAVLFLWGAGSLAQQDWSAPLSLAPRLAVLALAAGLALRPLSALSLDDESARAVGLPLGLIRAGGIVLAVLATATVTASVGVIGFLDLAAPQIARFSGARRFGTRCLAAPLIGALLLAAVDALVGLLEAAGIQDLPTGAATALMGGPLLIWLLPRLRLDAVPSAPGLPATLRRASPLLLPLLALLLLALVAATLLVGRSGGPSITEGWHLAGFADWSLVAPFRVPRTLVAMLAGGMLATAGLLLQRLTNNPLAAPEVLGIGTGIAAGLIAAMLISVAPGPALQLVAGTLGAFAAMAAILAVGQRARFAPEHLLLTGIAISALLDAFVVAFLALGDQRANLLLSWIAGSTYRADWASLAVTAIAAAILLPLAFLARRWLDILPLGEAGARALGLPLTGVRIATMALAAFLTAVSILAAGPLTFVGLLGPHLARMLGLRRAVSQIVGAALLGALVMVAADWLGRTLIAPRQIPAGIVAALIGLPYLFWQLGRRRA